MLSGIEFLKNVNSGGWEGPWKKVAVIGGGNVAIDVARVLKRLGLEPLVIYRRSQGEMPALQEEVDKAEQEGVSIRFLTQPVEIVRKESRIILKCVKMKLGAPDASGRPQPVAEEGSEFDIEFDAVIKAFGEEPDLSLVPQEFLPAIKKLQDDPSTYLLGANVFAGGDFISGPSTVVQAISAGRKAAGQIDRFLGGPVTTTTGNGAAASESPEKFNGMYLKKTARERPPEVPVKERLQTLGIEDIGTLDLSQVDIEANRCFNCGCVAVNSSDIAPALIALDARIKTNQRAVKAEQFFTVKSDKTTVLNDAEIVLEIEVPAPGPHTRCKFIKYALRKSIDFPVVNCAAAIEIREGIVENARVCLNAVYNRPYRAVKVEQYITGKRIDEANAEAAANEITPETLPLVNNRYKIQIAKTLIKRAILACK